MVDLHGELELAVGLFDELEETGRTQKSVRASFEAR